MGHLTVGTNDLATLRPDLVAELVEPSLGTELTVGSDKKVAWHCTGTTDTPHPHFQWGARVADRTTKGSGCPSCAGRAIIAGWNDLATLRPDLTAQLVKPSLGTELTVGSQKKVAWHCTGTTDTPHPHFQWDAKVTNRATNGSGCPACAGKAIIAGWNDLATLRPDLTAQLVKPSLRTELTVGSQKKVAWHCTGTTDTPHPHFQWDAKVTNRATNGNGCPACAGKAVIAGWNDLATLRPDLTAQLVKPSLGTELTVGSGKNVAWHCTGTTDTPHPHFQWDAKVANRTKGRGCPKCAKYGYDPTAQGHLYRFRFTDDRRAATCFGKTNIPDQRMKSYTSPKKGLQRVADIEVLHVGNGDDATLIENLILGLMSDHAIPACGDNGVTTTGAVKEAFYWDEATPEFIAEFDALWEQARQEADTLVRESALQP